MIHHHTIIPLILLSSFPVCHTEGDARGPQEDTLLLPAQQVSVLYCILVCDLTVQGLGQWKVPLHVRGGGGTGGEVPCSQGEQEGLRVILQ